MVCREIENEWREMERVNEELGQNGFPYIYTFGRRLLLGFWRLNFNGCSW